MADTTFIQRIRGSFIAIQRSTATSGTVSMTDTTKDLTFIHEAGATATITFQLPPNPVDSQVVKLISTGGVTVLSLTASVGTILSGITTLAVGGAAEYTYLSSTSKWYKTA